MGADNRWLYVAKRNHGHVVLERIDRASRQVEKLSSARLNVVAEVEHSDGAGLPYTVQIGQNQSLLMIPQRTILARNHTHHPKALQASLTLYGGTAIWRELDTSPACILEHSCASGHPIPPHKEPFDAPFIGSVVAVGGLGCTAIVVGLICERWRPYRNRTDTHHTDDQAATPLIETQTSDDSEDSMDDLASSDTGVPVNYS